MRGYVTYEREGLEPEDLQSMHLIPRLFLFENSTLIGELRDRKQRAGG